VVACLAGAALALYPLLRSETPAPPTPPGRERLSPEASHARMLEALQEVLARTLNENPWLGDRDARELRPVVAAFPKSGLTRDQWWMVYRLGVEELRLGNVDDAVGLLERVVRTVADVRPRVAAEWRNKVTYRLGVAYIRLAETQNCCVSSRPGSCMIPFTEVGRHTREEGARGAIRCFTEVAENTDPKSDLHMGARWLLNLATMFIGEHPDAVPVPYRIPPEAYVSEGAFPTFPNIAPKVHVDRFSLSGGAVADDFDNDGYLDLLISTWDPGGEIRYRRNQRDGTFADRTEEANLRGLLGGLNIVQADYDNDGNLDAYVLRGAWVGRAGGHPNSLLRNVGGGRFIDMTFAAGLGEVSYPTQTGAWADYDNDGDLDLYVGNEASAGIEATETLRAPCQLFRNNGDGTFTDVAAAAGVTNDRYTKAAVWGDYDADRFPDLFVSNLGGENRLYHNERDGTFTDVAPTCGLTRPLRSFPAWFWDFDNDGNLDLYVSAYAADIWHLARAALGQPPGIEMARLWRGDGHGGFVDVALASGLTRPNSPMGSNFGDLDNDGYLDFYLGTGFPYYDTVMPNVMSHNLGGRKFEDVSTTGGFAHVQKGHAVFFADLDNDGDQDVFEEMGGAYPGDGFYDALYENPGFGRHWIAVRLVGVRSNRSAIGARIRVVVAEDGKQRSIFKHVNSGGTFGANPLRQSIGLGEATSIVRLEVYWPTTGETQVFTDVPLDAFVRIVEGEDKFEPIKLKRLTLGR
jgi:hypothetical protein